MPTAVLIPVNSISSRFCTGIVQVFVRPGNWSFSSISWMSFSYVMPGRHCSRGFSMMVVSYISSGALSVALSERPTVPKTVSTSGNDRMMRSCSCNNALACVMEIPGSALGI